MRSSLSRRRATCSCGAIRSAAPARNAPVSAGALDRRPPNVAAFLAVLAASGAEQGPRLGTAGRLLPRCAVPFRAGISVAATGAAHERFTADAAAAAGRIGASDRGRAHIRVAGVEARGTCGGVAAAGRIGALERPRARQAQGDRRAMRIAAVFAGRLVRGRRSGGRRTGHPRVRKHLRAPWRARAGSGRSCVGHACGGGGFTGAAADQGQPGPDEARRHEIDAAKATPERGHAFDVPRGRVAVDERYPRTPPCPGYLAG
jgi:hypothetical protein